MARDSTNAGSSTGQTTDSRYRSVNSSQDPHGRETGNYETFPVAEQGLGPPTPVPPPGRKRDRTGAEVPEISLTNAIRSLTWEDVKKLPHQRCVRDALLTGMISGFLVGGARAILGGDSCPTLNPHPLLKLSLLSLLEYWWLILGYDTI